MTLLVNHTWARNVRELQSAIKYAIVHSRGEVLTPECLPRSVVYPAPNPAAAEPTKGLPDVAALVSALIKSSEPDIYRQVCLEVDRVLLETALRQAKGNQ